MPKPTVDGLRDLVLRSGLVDQEKFNSFWNNLLASADPAVSQDVDAIAQQMVEAGIVSRWQCDKLLEGRHRGFFLGNYKLIDHLGSGGMSSVYLAEHTLMRRRVAIKVLPKNRVEDTSYLDRFYREARAVAALDHRNIVHAYDVDHDGSLHYLVMELVDGRDLQRIVADRGPLSYAKAAEYIRQAAEGLGHAHGAGLIHRDVKPANLLLDKTNTIKILDLGLARFSQETGKASLTVTHNENVLGTADYLAPEQARDSHGVDMRADVYSLGCSLYFLLTGHAPFCEGTLPQRLAAHQSQSPPDIRIDRPDAPEDLIQICLKMMAKRPSQRYQSMAEVSATMTDWLIAHGHATESGAAISSARMAALSGTNLAAGRSGLQTKAQGGSSAVRVIDGTETVRPDAAVADTGSGRKQPTTKGVPGGKPATRSGAKPAGNLPTGKPIEPEPSSGIDFLNDLRDKPGSRVSRKPAGSSSVAVTATRGRRRQSKSVPLWVWALIGGGAVLAIVLFIVLIMVL